MRRYKECGSCTLCEDSWKQYHATGVYERVHCRFSESKFYFETPFSFEALQFSQFLFITRSDYDGLPYPCKSREVAMIRNYYRKIKDGCR